MLNGEGTVDSNGIVDIDQFLPHCHEVGCIKDRDTSLN